MRMRCAVIATLLSFVAPAAALAQAGDTPNRKVTMIVGFAPGGGVDVLARGVVFQIDRHADHVLQAGTASGEQ